MKEVKNKNKWLTITTVGFALFAMFFGAGNLILPPFIGLQTAENWAIALLGFFITAIIAPFLGVLMVAKVGTHFTDLSQNISGLLIKLLTLVIILCIGPLIAIPRTGATTFEVGIQPLLPNFSKILFLLLFFGVVLLLSISKAKIVAIIGRYLTPFLLFVLLLLIVLGVVMPISEVQTTTLTPQGSFVLGFTEGYQTMDVLASVIFAGIVIGAISNSGYHQAQQRTHITLWSGVVSTLCLLFIYGGLIYLGATSGYPFSEKVQRTKLLLHISHSVLGHWGTMAIAVAIGFACLTTAIALTSAVGDFFEEFTKGKISYKVGVVLCTLVSVVLSVNSVDAIIQYAGLILLFLYPIVFTIILYELLFSNFVRNRIAYLVSIAITAVVSAIAIAEHLNLPLGSLYQFRQWLPLSSYQLEWVLPSLIGFVITTIFVKFVKIKK